MKYSVQVCVVNRAVFTGVYVTGCRVLYTPLAVRVYIRVQPQTLDNDISTVSPQYARPIYIFKN